MSRSAASTLSSSTGTPSTHIWAARNVEWPIPSALSTANYQKLWRASRQTGAQLGIASADAPNEAEPESASSTTAATPRMASAPGDNAESTSYFTGFMNRVLNTTGTAQGDNKSDPNKAAADGGGANGSGGSRPLRPPRPHCVATANGWIVAALECPSPTAGILRLVSRWNVRRGSSADQWMALPPPCGTSPASSSSSSSGRVQHVFVDPTGCHTIVSAQNGEAYYLHSSLRLPQKLAGFGPNADGSLPTTLTGIPATRSSHTGMGGSASTSAVKDNTQQGLTAGSYITAVAWDVERGTEGSTKKILLGTNVGEIYEYALISPISEEKEEAMANALLLHRLVRDIGGEEGPAAVTGLHLERLRTGLLILASTSSRNTPRTRLYTFYSPHNTSFRMALADQQHATLVDIPGAVDFAELRLCNDHFGLRTAMGIYYGTIDRSQSSNVLVTGGRSMIIDSGILDYADVVQESATSSSASNAISSLALTPHHMILLNDATDHHHHHNRAPEVRFINRVAQKVIQKERMDLLTQHAASSQQSNNPFATSSASALEDSAFWLGAGELLMDIRRPDQVWLRQGRSLIHVSSTQEDRDVWKFTLSKCLEKPKGQRGGATPSSSMVSSPSLSRSISGAGPLLTEEEKAQEALFEQAKNLCTNAAQKAVVTNIRAEYHLSQGRAELAAKYLAQCPPALAPFADTSIRLALPRLGIDDPQGYGHAAAAKTSLAASNIPLITYLSDKLRVAQMNQDKMASTMLGAWLTELYLHERGDQQPRGTSAGGRKDDAMLSQFLGNLQQTDAKTIMKVLASHDVSATECASYAAQSGDIATAVNTALAVGSANASAGAQDALRILNSAPFELAEPLYYRHASSLLARAPALAGNSFLTRYAKGLAPTRLLPSIMYYEKLRRQRKKKEEERIKVAEELTGMGGGGVMETKEEDQGDHYRSEGFKKKNSKLGALNTSSAGFVDDPKVSIKYLEGVIQQGCRTSAVFSFLISLYVKLEDEDPLYRFLSAHVPSATTFADAALTALMSCDRSRPQQMMSIGDEEFSTPLDMSYALRAVLSSGRHFRSAIKLYMGFGMRQQAVELALKVDPSLARELAQDSTELEERKRLWLMIAKHAASSGTHGGKDVVAKVVSVLRDCGPDVLSIEDVLPFLPDFAQIDQIKDEICEALTAYSSKIEGFLKEMNDCDQTCSNLREDIKRLRTHRMKVKSDARCALTNQPVLNAGEPFYVFPSGYVFLASAIKKDVMPFLNERQKIRVAELERQLQNINNMASTNAEDESRARTLQTELDGLIAAECPLTGSVLVNSIDKGFEDSEEIDADMFSQLHGQLGRSITDADRHATV